MTRPALLRHPLAPLLLVAATLAAPLHAAHVPAPYGRDGAVASAAPAATDAGIEVLCAGGNAADAAVAVALALAVVHPEAGNLGGGGFAVVRHDGEIATLDFRETAPAAASRDMYLDAGGEPVAELSRVGPLAAGVPGSPAGLYALHRRYGQLPWAQVVAPALRLARDGFVVTRRLEEAVRGHAALLRRFPESAAVWLPGGRPPAAGTVMRLPVLAETLAAYAEQGPAAISTGRRAGAVEAASSRYGGVLTAADLAAYRPEWRQPVRFTAFGWQVASMGLPSSGGIILGETAGILERTGWRSRPRFGAGRAHLLVEAWRRAFADRFLLGDPATTAATAAQLLDPLWLGTRAASVDPDRATRSEDVEPFGGAAASEQPETTHLAVVDGQGNAVSLTTTINGIFGCGLLVPETGFFLNNEMDDFAALAGTANMFRLVQGEANAIAAGKRMLSSMAPTIAWNGDELVALGGRGGSKIPTAVAQVLLAVVVDGDPLQTAVDRPRLHHQWQPDEIAAEGDALAPETAAALAAMGHRVVAVRGVPKVNAVRRNPDGTVEAAADPRGPGAAAVVTPIP